MGKRIALTLSIVLILVSVVPWRSYTDHTHLSAVQWIPFYPKPLKAEDIIANILLYAPFGYLYTQQRERRGLAWRLFAYAALLSLATEATQTFSHVRFPSSGDWVCNVGGALAGMKLALRRERLPTAVTSAPETTPES